MDTAAREQLQGEEYFLDLRTLDADFGSLDELSADGLTLDISDTPSSHKPVSRDPFTSVSLQMHRTRSAQLPIFVIF